MGIIVRLCSQMALRRSCCLGDLNSRMNYYASHLKWWADFCKNRECPAYYKVIKSPRPWFSKLIFTPSASANTYSRALLKATKSESVNVDSGIFLLSSLGDSRVWTLSYELEESNSDFRRPKDFLRETAFWFYLWPGPSRPEQRGFSAGVSNSFSQRNHVSLAVAFKGPK